MKALRRLYLRVRLLLLQRELEDLECNASLIDDNRQRLRRAIADASTAIVHSNPHPIAADGCEPH